MSFDGPERVLVLITSLNRGGAETMAMNYYRHFDRNVIQYDFLVNREEIGAYEEEITKPWRAHLPYCAQCIHSTFIVIRKNSVLF